VAHPFVELDIDVTDDILPPILQPPDLSSPLPGQVSSPPAFRVPPFYHGPPPLIHGCHCWPTAPDTHAIITVTSSSLLDILVLVTPYLDQQALRTILSLSTTFWCGIIGTTLSFTQPWSPYRQQRWGFGIPSADQSATHDSPSAIGMLHHIWQYIQPADCLNAYAVCTSWRDCIHLQIDVCRLSVAKLHLS
jgi:hypothetical protein